MKLIFSWVAKNNDFLKSGEINKDGPIWSLHKFFWNTEDIHVVLNSNKNERDDQYEKLTNALIKEKVDFKDHKIERLHLPIDNVINVSEILSKVQGLLSSYKKQEIEIFVSPGTPAMQVAWYFASINFKHSVKLFQTTKDSKAKEPILLNDSVIPTNLNLVANSNDLTNDEFVLTTSIESVYEKALSVAQADKINCLILGDNGTGKEHLANYIHKNSAQSTGPFITINCAAFNDDLLLSELFGYTKGAFTGANENKMGLFQKANNGTIFLDEIGEISPKMQASLLRVVQQKQILPIGATEVININVRIIAATNKPLYEKARKDEFRLDLYYRLAVAELKLPSLNGRGKKELEEYLDKFIDTIWKSTFPNRKSKLKLSKEVRNKLLDYNYPGNLRELENIIKRLYTFCKDEVTLNDLPEIVLSNEEFNSIRLEDVEKMHIKKVFIQKNENINQTAKALNISRNTLKSKLDQYDNQENN